MNIEPQYLNFDSVTDWLAYNESVPSNPIDNSWAGMSYHKAKEATIHGDSSLVTRAEKLLNEIPWPETEDRIYQPSPMGSYVCVPEYLAGFPECMRTKQTIESEGTPIRVFANVFMSAYISLDDAMKRGITVAALLMKLQATHPIELKLVISHDASNSRLDKKGNSTLITVNVGLLPIDLSVLAFLLAHPSCYRQLMLRTNKREYHAYPASEAWTREKLGINDNDLYIHSLVLGDPLTKEPINWITSQVARFNNEEVFSDD